MSPRTNAPHDYNGAINVPHVTKRCPAQRFGPAPHPLPPRAPCDRDEAWPPVAKGGPESTLQPATGPSTADPCDSTGVGVGRVPAHTHMATGPVYELTLLTPAGVLPQCATPDMPLASGEETSAQ